MRAFLPHAPRAVAWGLSLAAAPAVAAAQATTGTVAGRVTNAETGEPVAGATVAVTGTSFGAITRSDGTYRIALRPGTYELRARLIGYAVARDSAAVVAGAAVTRTFRLARAAASALSGVAVIGSRVRPRSVIESPVPVDVLPAAEIRATGRTETAQMLQAVAPSVNFPRATISDGTDVVRPLTLRGLGADQALVLVNGKRRHPSALINVNGSVGRGQAAVDLNAIPASMIDRIEVLREGAAAQYGSDAIAGVINIVLKSSGQGEASTTLGETSTTYAKQYGPGRSAHDGGVFQAALNGGAVRPAGGYFYAGGEYRDRGYTNRTLGDPRPQVFGDTARTNLTGPINHRQGDAATKDGVGFFNGAFGLRNGIELYSFGGFGRRGGQSAGFFRRGLDDRTIRTFYPSGYLPLISSTIYDLSSSVGARGTVGGWRSDLSTTFGGNSFRFDVDNSNNVSLGPTVAKTSFYSGTLVFRQSSTNLDLAREYRLPTGQPLRVATGAEFRVDAYRIKPGEPDSYRNGGQPIVGTATNPNAVVTARPAPLGAQVFPGFRPTDATSQSRNNVSLYADLESDVTSRFLVGLAGRFEHFSDFGSTTNGRLTARYNLTPGFVLRGAASTGFRAPSLQQSYFSSTATNFINVNGNLQPFDVRTFPVGTAEARALGATALKPEKSVNYSAGFALAPARALGVTVDLYQIRINDRVVLSENFTGPAVAAALAAAQSGANGGRFFTNAIETRTRGVDVVANYVLDLQSAGTVRLLGGANYNGTRVLRVNQTPTALANQQEALFGRVERGRIEHGQPRNNFLLSGTYERGRGSLTLRSQRFGAVTSFNALTAAGVPSSPDQTFSPKWVSDVSAGFRFVPRATLTLGADNVFDVYPDENSDRANPSATASGNANFGIFPYSQFSPFGFNGRFVYARVSVGL